MLFLLMVFCAAGAIILVGLTAYNEYLDLTHVEHPVTIGDSRFRRPKVK